MILRHAPPNDYTCARKVAYRRLHSAVWFARKSMRLRDVQLYAYRCNVCRLWHLTSHPKPGALLIEPKDGAR